MQYPLYQQGQNNLQLFKGNMTKCIPQTGVQLYSLCQKKRTFNAEFFCGPPGGLGPKIHMVDYVNGSSNRPCEFLAPLCQGGHNKIRDLMCVSFDIDCKCLNPLHACGFKQICG